MSNVDSVHVFFWPSLIVTFAPRQKPLDSYIQQGGLHLRISLHCIAGDRTLPYIQTKCERMKRGCKASQIQTQYRQWDHELARRLHVQTEEILTVPGQIRTSCSHQMVPDN